MSSTGPEGSPFEPLSVVVAGAGVGGLEFTLALADLAGERVAVTIVEPRSQYVERASAITDAMEGRVHNGVPVDDLLRTTEAEVLRDSVVAVDHARHEVLLRRGGRKAYDMLVVATGASARQAPAGVLILDPEQPAPLRRLADEVADGSVGRVGIIVPPGRHWTLPAYELALMLARRAKRAGHPPQILVAALEPQPLSIFGSAAYRTLLAELKDAGVRLLASEAAEADPGPPPSIVLHHRRQRMFVDRVVSLPILRPRLLAGLPDHDCFLPVDAEGRVADRPDVFAIGDVTDYPLKLGSIAAQHAETVARVIARAAGAPVEPSASPPVPRGLLLTGAGAHRLQPDPDVLPEHDEERGSEGPPLTKVAAPRLAARLAALGAAQLGPTGRP
jgi:sulfide:quinone oxidoreductase